MLPLRSVVWKPISTTSDYLIQSNYPGFLPEDVYFCHIYDNGAFSMWDQRGIEYRYNPHALRTYNSGTCSTGNTDLGEWSRYDMTYEMRFQSHVQFLGIPESIAGDEAWVLERLNDPPRVRDEMQFYDMTSPSLPQDTVSQKLIRGETRNWKLAYFSFKPSSEPVPSEAVVVPWNVQCDFDKLGNFRLFSASAKGKFYFFCPISVDTGNSTVTNLYTYDNDTGLTQGPRRIQAPIDLTSLEKTYMHLVSGSAQDAEPAFAILTIARDRHIVIDLRANGSLPDWEEFRYPRTMELEPECSTKGSTTKLIVACTLSALFLASFLAFFCIQRRRRAKSRSIPMHQFQPKHTD
ncbi:hypothetical protein BGZ94_007348 [Podila epigama]|nr:hypothetical protein BGZ94_007348 [Podila epigama]